jgi:transcription termination factor Rho
MQQDEPTAANDVAPASDDGAVALSEAPPRRRVRRRVAPLTTPILSESPADGEVSVTAAAPLPVAPPSPEPTAGADLEIPGRESPGPQPLAPDAGRTTDAPLAATAVDGVAPAETAEDEIAGKEAERAGSRRRRSRRGRHVDAREEGEAEPAADGHRGAAEGLTSTPMADAPLAETGRGVPDAAPEAGAPDRETNRQYPDQSPYRSGGARRDIADAPTGAEGRESRQGAPSDRANRADGRGRRDWRDQPEPRDQRDGQRPPQRDRQAPLRDRGYSPGRDGRQNGSVARDQGRELQPYRESPREVAAYREPAGYRDAGAREAPVRDRGPEAVPTARPTEVVTRGYVVSVDQNQNQWQLRTRGHLPSPQDATIPLSVIRANDVRMGDEVVGLVRSAAPGRRYGELLDVQSINGIPVDRATKRPRFDDLTPIYPERHMRLERPESITARLIDIVCPIGFGQRAMIVSPPKAGKTTILKEIGRSINVNYPNVKLIVCLVGERPEEVTDLAKSLEGEVISSTFDEAINHHTELAEITIERARRLVESGFDVVVLLDSVTRLARAYNLSAPGDSRSLSGGMATTALYPPKRFFGAARALQEGGSLTVIATCLVDTNSRLDDVIYEELKGTGNMELVLDRRLSEERVFPAIDIVKSSTRREELLLQPNELTAVTRLRRALAMGNDQVNNTQRIVQQMERTRTNAEFLASLLTQSSAR